MPAAHRSSWLDGQAVGNRVLGRIAGTNPGELGWDWGSSLLGDALGEWSDAPGVVRFLRQWVRHHQKLGTSFQDSGGWHWKAGAGTTLLRLQSSSPTASRSRWIATLGRHILDCPTGPDGIWLTKPERREIWIDTLAMACPFLARAGAAGFGETWIKTATQQIIAHADLLQSAHSGLWVHAWRLAKNRPMGCLWARGNGWAIHALVEVLAVTGTRREPRLAGILGKTCRGLLDAQAPCGSWHTILDDSYTYVETSGQALLVRGLAKAARLGLVPSRIRRALREAARRGWVAVASHVSDSGEVTGTSLGTPAGSVSDYADRPVASWPVWGPASVLLAAREISLIR